MGADSAEHAEPGGQMSLQLPHQQASGDADRGPERLRRHAGQDPGLRGRPQGHRHLDQRPLASQRQRQHLHKNQHLMNNPQTPPPHTPTVTQYTSLCGTQFSYRFSSFSTNFPTIKFY